jgi:rhamnosyltransferase
MWPKWLAAAQAQQPVLYSLVVDSASNDGTDFSNLPSGYKLLRIETAEFNHGTTRNLALDHIPAGTDVVVFLTQDALLADVHTVQTLVDSLKDPEVACAYGRQLPHADATPIAAHARSFNYPETSRIISIADHPQLGIKTCFLSNSFAAYRLSDLVEIGGFPADVVLGEDMSAAARLLMAGRRIAYVANSCVFHSHNYSIKQEFQRYFDTGVFHARSPWLLLTFGSAEGEGVRFVYAEFNYLMQYAPIWIPSAAIRTMAKWLGYKLGRREANLPLFIKRMCSMHKGYWS